MLGAQPLQPPCELRRAERTDSLLEGHGREQRNGAWIALQVVRQVLHGPQGG